MCVGGDAVLRVLVVLLCVWRGRLEQERWCEYRGVWVSKEHRV